jgi:hypothetical protein
LVLSHPEGVGDDGERRVDRIGLTIGYIVGGVIMIAGGLVEVAFGINAEGQALETVARPLTEVSG